MKYKQISVKIKHDEVDLVSYAFIEAGSEGVNIIDGNDINEVINSSANWDYYDKTLLAEDTENAVVIGGFACDFDAEELNAGIQSYVGRDVELNCEICDSLDWENEWRKYYTPINFGGIVIVPAWMKNEYGDKGLFLEPGMAFGTGNHETTGMCIKLMQRIEVRDKTVIDIGCGSGILGLSALKLGAKECVFVDNDSMATDAALSNLKLNGFEKQTIVCGDLVSRVDKRAEVVIANITADILLRLVGDIDKVVCDGGLLILSGIIDDRVTGVVNAYLGKYKLIEGMHEKEWNALLLQKID